MSVHQATIDAMSDLARRTSEALEGRYVTVELNIRAHQGRVTYTWTGYTESSGHKTHNSLEDVALSILPPAEELKRKAADLREEAEKLEALANSVTEVKL